MGFLKIQFVAKYQKKLEGGPFGDKKSSKKKLHSAEKNLKGDPINSSGFVSYVKKGVNERGLCTNLTAFPVQAEFFLDRLFWTDTVYAGKPP